MKCALDLATIATAERMRRREEIKKSSIEWCEESIGKDLERCAIAGLEIRSVSYFMSSDKLGLYYTMGFRTPSRYKDHRTDWVTMSLELLDLQTIIKHLENHCFEVELIDMTFSRYGIGECPGYKIIVTPNAECLRPSL